MNLLEEGKKVFDCEIHAAQLTRDTLSNSFEEICNVVDTCKGRVILTGIGKSGHICRKIVATMQSLGIKAHFMHPAEALHGDLGMLTAEDIIIAVSNSGETDEILGLLPAINKIAVPLYCIVGKANSTLSKFSKFEILLPTLKEAYLESLVPTSSTTACLILGDAIAVSVAKKRGFTSKDFGVFHPNGLLGKRLTLQVKSLMLTGDENAVILCGSSVEDAVFEMCRKPIGGVNIMDETGRLKGIFTDGDLRRLYKDHGQEEMGRICIDSVMTKTPITVDKTELVSKVIEDAKRFNRSVSFYPVVEDQKLVGSLRLADISKSGLL